MSPTRTGRTAFLAAASGHMEQIRRAVLDHVDPEKIGELGDILRPIAEGLRAGLSRG
ncbi:hypothetical protein N8K70_03470 [Microbacterium betulae]|uniref:MarR family transcriptional regulator n=1 Tax=Microbacterium betulae TaxID=2981139 RepID=A0AA97FHN4_9MICO|nr:hypothetical protein [Microbacterium sp. AB]WOF23751.1 hypothetical protein N8K70_03470 [Microbacterium sp. AB]